MKRIEKLLQQATAGDVEAARTLADEYNRMSHECSCIRRQLGSAECDCIKDRITSALYALNIDVS